MKKLAIGIPTINRFDFLKENLDAIYRYLPVTDVYIYNNSSRNLSTKVKLSKNVKILGCGTNIGVAASWNTMLTDMKSNGFDYALILNDDIVLSENIKNIYELLDTNLSFARIINDWSVFLISMQTFDKVGLFDEKFYPAYFEDCDYNYRLKLAKIETEFPKILIPEVYRNSSSIELNPSLNINYMENRLYYIRKWGGEPMYEVFINPFNIKE